MAIEAINELIDVRQKLPGRDIDALVCANDYMATGVQMTLLERGYRIPVDIALVGFDDILYSKCLIPSLSSISYPDDKMVTRAFDLLIAMLFGEQVPASVNIPTEFIPRSSCGCLNQYIPAVDPHFSGNTNAINIV